MVINAPHLLAVVVAVYEYIVVVVAAYAYDDVAVHLADWAGEVYTAAEFLPTDQNGNKERVESQLGRNMALHQYRWKLLWISRPVWE